jgi:ABC-type multidrug transport system fused ATPase/permease subunit
MPGFRPLLRVLRAEFSEFAGGLVIASALASLVALLEVGILFLIGALTSGAVADETPKLPFDLHPSLTTLAVCALVTIVLRGLLDIATGWYQMRLVYRYECHSRQRVFTVFLDAEWSTQAEVESFEVLNSVTTFLNQSRMMARRITDVLSYAVSFVAMLAGSFLSGGLWVLVILVGTGLLALGLKPIMRDSHSAGGRVRDASRRFGTAFGEAFLTAREVRLLDVVGAVKERTNRSVMDLAEANRASGLASYMLGTLYRSAIYLAAGIGLLVIVSVDLGSKQAYVTVVLLLYRGLGYGQSLQSGYQDLINNEPAIRALQEITGEMEQDAVPTTGIDFAPPFERIAFSDVGLTYPSGTLAVDHVDFELERGDVLGIVGPSGSGKSTIVQLILRLRLPTSGTIRVNGVDMAEINPYSWFGRAALVPQEARLFSGSVLENVQCFRTTVDEAAARDAMARCEILDEMLSLPGGLDFQVGESGAKLSGGQRQRLCIARALAGSPDLIVLDEPTSALDLVSEEAIRATLAKLSQEQTLVIVAHRLSTLRICRRVMVVKDGRIQDVGTREELEGNSAFYSEAVRLARLV